MSDKFNIENKEKVNSKIKIVNEDGISKTTRVFYQKFNLKKNVYEDFEITSLDENSMKYKLLKL